MTKKHIKRYSNSLEKMEIKTTVRYYRTTARWLKLNTDNIKHWQQYPELSYTDND